jgi:hypothetical protein
MDIDTCPVMIPVTQKETSFTIFFFGLRNEPVNEIGTVLIMLQAI